MSAYNPRLRWLNQKPRRVLAALYVAAYPLAIEHAGLLTTDRLKCGLLVWAEGRHGVVSLEGLEAR